MLICIALFGLNRSLPWTYTSILANLLRPLRQYGAQVKLYGHFNIPQSIENPRSGERVSSFKNRGLDLLPFDHLILTPQNDEEIAGLLERFKLHDLQSNDSSIYTHRNLINQYRSLHAVMQMIQSVEGNDVDIVLFARPDVEYIDELAVNEELPKLLDGSADLLTPTWHRWGGLNDRVSLCSFHAAKVYANRISMLDDVLQVNLPMNAESILLHAIQSNHLTNGDLSIRGVRVRATGYTVDEGFDLDYITQLRFLKRRVISKVVRVIDR
jgi:hypothetical protein